MTRSLTLITTTFACGALTATAFAGLGLPPKPDAVIDLRTPAGAALVAGQWRYADAHIVEIAHRDPGPDLKASGPANRTHDIEPKAGVADFDDSAWQPVAADGLEARRSTGRLAGGWYRIGVTVPTRIGETDPTGGTLVFEIVADDYAEVWVDGRLPQALGQSGGPLVAGWNAPNRVVIARDVRPGQRIQLAVFVMNGPLSDPPANFVWLRSATLDFYKPGRLPAVQVVPVDVIRADPAIDAIVPPGAQLERIAEGFDFTEGPLWAPGTWPGDEGCLLFSDPNRNTIYRWSPLDGQVCVYRTKSGYAGLNIAEYRQPGSNGLTLDADGRLTICEHGNRRVTRLEKNGVLTVLADRFDGRRLNSPNDLVYRSDGALFFTDPAFGLPRGADDPRRELPHMGVYGLIGGQLRLVSSELTGPNGLAFSPDERHLYVGNWDEQRKVVMRYEVAADGTVAQRSVFFDLTAAPGQEAIDGVKVDTAGNVYISGPGGLWIVSSRGKHLGTIRGPELPANFTFGDTDGRMLYMTARGGVYRMRLGVPGIRPALRASGVAASVSGSMRDIRP